MRADGPPEESLPARTRLDSLLGPGLAMLALVVYAATTSSAAYPGQSAELIVQHAGLVPCSTPAYPLWTLLARIAALVPVGTLALRLNLVSSVLAAASVWVLYEVTRLYVYESIGAETDDDHARTAGRVAGTVAALALAFCSPFWIAANRAHHATLGILLALFAALTAVRYVADGNRKLLFLLAFLCGVGVVEFAGLALFLPLLLWYVWRAMPDNDDRGENILAGMAGVAVCGLLMAPLAAVAFRFSTGYAAGGYSNLLEVIGDVLRHQVQPFRRAVGTDSMMMILCAYVLPWLAAVLITGWALNTRFDATSNVLALALTGIGCAVLLNAPFTLWSSMGVRPLIVVPYLLVAFQMGFTASYWYLALRATIDTTLYEPNRINRYIAPVMLVACAACVVLAAFRNAPESNARGARFLRTFANAIVKHAGERSWLLVDGEMETQLRLAIHEQRAPIRLLRADRPVTANTPPPQPGQGNDPETAVNLGPYSLIKALSGKEPEGYRQAVVVSCPGVWTGSGYVPVARGVVYTGQRSIKSLDADEMLAEHEKFTAAHLPALRQQVRHAPLLEESAAIVARQLSRNANDLGVLLQDLGRHADAARLYRQAAELDPDNISALLNRKALVDEGRAPGDLPLVNAAFEDLLANAGDRPGIWALARLHGYVREPRLFAALGYNWALSGRRTAAGSDGEDTFAGLPTGLESDLRRTLIELYLPGGFKLEPESIYKEESRLNPMSRRAQLGLAAHALRRGDLEAADEYLGKAEEVGVPADSVAVQRAALLLMRGDIEGAGRDIDRLVRRRPDLLSARALQAAVLVRRGEHAQLEECFAQLAQFREGMFYVRLAHGDLALRHSDLELAAASLREAARNRPGSIGLRELIVVLDLVRQRPESLAAQVSALLYLDAENAVGHYASARLHTWNGHLDLAEDSLQESISTRPTAGALAELASLVFRRGAYAEAEESARASLAMDPDHWPAWDALGLILMYTDRAQEAEQAFEKALQFRPGDVRVLLHKTRLFVMNGDIERAVTALKQMEGKDRRLSAEERSLFLDLRGDLGIYVREDQ